MKSFGDGGEMEAASGSSTGFRQKVVTDMVRNTLLEMRPSLSVEHTPPTLIPTAVTDR